MTQKKDPAYFLVRPGSGRTRSDSDGALGELDGVGSASVDARSGVCGSADAAGAVSVSGAVAALDTGRRGVLAGSGLALLGGLLGSGGTRAQEAADWDEVEKQNVRVVEEFCNAWATRDLKNVTATMADNCIYRMSETTPAVHGHDGLAEQMQGWIDTSHTIIFEILQTVAKGPIVMNHRIDYWMSDTRPVTWEGVGVFFLQNGKIVEWSDYNIRVERG